MIVKTNYKGILNILAVLYIDRICTEDHFVENRIKTLSPTKGAGPVGVSIGVTLFVCMLSHRPLDGMLPNLQAYINRTGSVAY